MTSNPEFGQHIDTGDYIVNYHQQGHGDTVLLLHGSGPGVTGFANWRLLMPVLAENFRVIVPDVAGFGYTQVKGQFQPTLSNWVSFATSLMDALNVPLAHLVGNSFGGALALALARTHPERVRRMVLMGAAGVNFPITDGLEQVWGYTPSLENMRRLMDIFTNPDFQVSDDIVRMRYEASIRPGYQESYQQLFPPPRQAALEGLCLSQADIRAIQHKTLVVHGRQDRVIPLQSSLQLLEWLPNADLHVYSQCGHWTMFEKAVEFNSLVSQFFLQNS